MTSSSSRKKDCDVNVAVLGAGISGLTAAYVLAAHCAEVDAPRVRIDVLEKSVEVGGSAVCTTVGRGDGQYRVDCGVHSFRSTGTGVVTLDLVHSLGLQAALCPPSKDGSRNRFLLLGGRLQRLSIGLVLRVGGLRLLGELFVPRAPRDSEETIAEFFARRFGSRVADSLVSAFVSGVFAGDMRALSLRAAFPVFGAIEDESRSFLWYGVKCLLKAILMPSSLRNAWRRFRGRPTIEEEANAHNGWKGRGTAPSAWSLAAARRYPSYTFMEGMTQLPLAMAKALRDTMRVNVHLGCEVVHIDKEVEGDHKSKIVVSTKTANNKNNSIQRRHYDYVIAAVPSHALAPVLPDHHRAPTLSEIPFGHVEVLNCVFPVAAEKCSHNPRVNGFGYLVPGARQRAETEDPFKTANLGVIFDSASFPARYPQHLGPAYSVMLASPSTTSDATLRPYVDEALRGVVVATGDDVVDKNIVMHRTSWPRAIPQYTVGHTKRVVDARRAVASTFDGALVLCGFSYDGISFNDALTSGRNAGTSVYDKIVASSKMQKQ
eukprot:PhM_4_TR9143/c0_g2_i1/m.90212/K00231/PPOX, hemY; protoporphyrinogen/coproporphyrinogen III oxidase